MTPSISVAIVSPGGLEEIRRTLAHLAAQTIHKQVELVIAAPRAPEIGGTDPRLSGFAGVGLVEVAASDSTGTALAAAFRRATAPIVVCAEEHSYPEAGWAEALVAAHRGPLGRRRGAAREREPGHRRLLGAPVHRLRRRGRPRRARRGA